MNCMGCVRRRVRLLKAKKEENRVTRTINQLHFEDLDPIRFEELILAMAYKWRRWESINHFGKLGSDDGIDIEATENLYDRERMYIFQCKRKTLPFAVGSV